MSTFRTKYIDVELTVKVPGYIWQNNYCVLYSIFANNIESKFNKFINLKK